MEKFNKKYIFIILVFFFVFLKSIMATTIRETLIEGDGYDTIMPNTFIIGITKFTGDQIITASKASTAGANDAMFYASRHSGDSSLYKAPIIYYYVDANVGWFYFDSENRAYPVVDEDTLEMLSHLDIYYVNNVKKQLEVSYHGADINLDSLPSGVSFQNGSLLVDADKIGFDIETVAGDKISFVMDDTVSNFVEEISKCYTVVDGIIVSYDSSCGIDIVIPKSINGVDIVGIGANAFNDKGLHSVVIPSSVVSIGDNAFLNNPLESVSIDDKYNTDDFSQFSENAFDNGVTIDYENDLTQAINSLPSSYVIDVYDGLDIDDVDTGVLIRNAIIKEINKDNYNFHLDSSEVGKYYMIHYYLNNKLNTNECVDHKKGSFDIYFVLGGENLYSIYFEKRLENCTRIVSVNRDFQITYRRVGSGSVKNFVDDSVSHINTVSSNVGDEYQANLITNRKNIEDYIDFYDLDYLYEPSMQMLVDPASGGNIGGSFMKGDLFLFKDDILYQVVHDVGVINLSNSFYPSVSASNYENVDLFYEAVMEEFLRETGVSNYSAVSVMHGHQYLDVVSGASRIFYVSLFDRDKLEYWSIFSSMATVDNYDESGMTRGVCFQVNDGVIVSYDGSCGSNVRIPSSIDGVAIRGIADYTFYNFDLNSVAFSDGLVNIGEGAFLDNKITSVTIPSSVRSIGSFAFKNNAISSLNLPNCFNYFGSGVFTNNNMEDSDAFIYQREYDEDSSTYSVDNSVVNSYAGRKKEHVVIPSNITVLGDYSFQGVGIHDITLPFGIKRIGDFALASNLLHELVVPTSLVDLSWGALLDNEFSGDACFIYGADNNNQVDNSILMHYVSDCNSSYSSQVSTLSIPLSVREIRNDAFNNGYNIYVDEFVIPYGVEVIGNYAFRNVYFSNSISIPLSVRTLGVNLFPQLYTSNQDNAFVYGSDENGIVDRTILMAYVGDDSSSVLILPNQIKNVRENVFAYQSFSSIQFNDVLENIYPYAFSNMYNLGEIRLPNSLKKVFDHAFLNDYNVHSISLGDSILEVSDYAFDIQNSLDNLTLPASLNKVGRFAFPFVEHIDIYGKTSLNDFSSGFSLDNYGYGMVEFH